MQRFRGQQRLELAEYLTVATRREVRADRSLGRLQAQVLQPPDLGGRERLVGDVAERIAAPQRERLAGARSSSRRSKRTASTSPSESRSS